MKINIVDKKEAELTFNDLPDGSLFQFVDSEDARLNVIRIKASSTVIPYFYHTCTKVVELTSISAKTATSKVRRIEITNIEARVVC